MLDWSGILVIGVLLALCLIIELIRYRHRKGAKWEVDLKVNFRPPSEYSGYAVRMNPYHCEWEVLDCKTGESVASGHELGATSKVAARLALDSARSYVNGWQAEKAGTQIKRVKL